jgi:hypothetical protein
MRLELIPFRYRDPLTGRQLRRVVIAGVTQPIAKGRRHG